MPNTNTDLITILALTGRRIPPPLGLRVWVLLTRVLLTRVLLTRVLLTRVLLSGLLLALPLPAYADGNYLLQRCQVAINFDPDSRRYNNPADMAYCYGLLQGIRETNSLYRRKAGNDAYFCLDSPSLSHKDAATLVVSFLQANPQTLHRNETTLAVQAFRHHSPCP